MPSDLSVITKTYDLITWTIPKIQKFPRSFRFVLGDRLENHLLDLLELLIEAAAERDKIERLRRCNTLVAKLRHIFRLAHDFELIGAKNFQIVSEKLYEIGRMVGGWRKQQHEAAQPTI